MNGTQTRALFSFSTTKRREKKRRDERERKRVIPSQSLVVDKYNWRLLPDSSLSSSFLLLSPSSLSFFPLSTPDQWFHFRVTRSIRKHRKLCLILIWLSFVALICLTVVLGSIGNDSSPLEGTTPQNPSARIGWVIPFQPTPFPPLSDHTDYAFLPPSLFLVDRSHSIFHLITTWVHLFFYRVNKHSSYFPSLSFLFVQIFELLLSTFFLQLEDSPLFFDETDLN